MSRRPSDGTDQSAIAERLRLTRLALGLNQAEFAARAAIAGNTYNQYETGSYRVSLNNAMRLAKTYHLTLDWIYFGDNSGLPYKLGEAIKALRSVRDDTDEPDET